MWIERNEDREEVINEIKIIVAILIPLMLVGSGLAAYLVEIIK